jgi:hypothetical protein
MDRGPFQGKPDVFRLSEQDQRLAREIIRDTQNLAKIGNPAASRGTLPPRGTSPITSGGDLHLDTNGSHRPTNTMGAAAGGAC